MFWQHIDCFNLYAFPVGIAIAFIYPWLGAPQVAPVPFSLGSTIDTVETQPLLPMETPPALSLPPQKIDKTLKPEEIAPTQVWTLKIYWSEKPYMTNCLQSRHLKFDFVDTTSTLMMLKTWVSF